MVDKPQPSASWGSVSTLLLAHFCPWKVQGSGPLIKPFEASVPSVGTVSVPICFGLALVFSLYSRLTMPMAAQGPVSLELEDGVALITLHRPPVNALRPEGVQDVVYDMPWPVKSCCRRLPRVAAATGSASVAAAWYSHLHYLSPLPWHVTVWEALFPLLRKAHSNPSVKAIVLAGANGARRCAHALLPALVSVAAPDFNSLCLLNGMHVGYAGGLWEVVCNVHRPPFPARCLLPGPCSMLDASCLGPSTPACRQVLRWV